MKKKLLLIQCAIALILIFCIIGSVEAGSSGVSVIKTNGAGYDHSKYIVGTDHATVSKEIGFTVTGNGGQFSYSASGPVSATSKDGNVTVSVDAMKLAISGKTSGSGTATANATVLATGTAREDASTAYAIVESRASVSTGSKLGSATAASSAAGTAGSTALYGSDILAAGAAGATKASATVSSPKAVTTGDAEIVGMAGYGIINGAFVTDPFCDVASSVTGTGTATASATANGAANAQLIIPGALWVVGASGNTEASGTSKYTGMFYESAMVIAIADKYSPGGNSTWAEIETSSYTSGNDRNAQASGKATVKSGDAAADAVTSAGLIVLSSSAEGNANASSSIRSIGLATGIAEIHAESTEYGNFQWGDNFEDLGYQIDVTGRLVEDAYIWSDSDVVGKTVGFTGSAAGSASGVGEATGGFLDVIDPGYATNNGAAAVAVGGALKSSSTAKNLGSASAESAIVAVEAIDAKVSLGISAGIDDKLPVDLTEVGLQQGLGLKTDYYAPVFALSGIQQTVQAEGKASSDTAEAKASASGITTATGSYIESNPREYLTWGGESQAIGNVSGIAQANMCKDPASTSIIIEVASPIWEDSSLDIALVGSASYAHGKCGYTSAMASGTAGSDVTSGVTDAGAYASGTAKTMAQANNADSLALAAIAAGSYAGEEDMTIFGANGTLIDASLVGSIALSEGASGTAAAEAVGAALAYGSVSTAGGDVSGGQSASIDFGATESAVRVKNGIALDAAAVTSFGLMQLGQSGDVLQDNYANGVSSIVDVSFAEAAKKTDVAEAAGEAAGSTRMAGNFMVTDVVNNVTHQATWKTAAEGFVADAAEAVCADPLAASTVTSFAVVNSEPGFIPSQIVEGNLIGSIAMAEGQCANAAGEAAGFTVTSAELVIADSSNPETTVITRLHSVGNASGSVETAANANGGLALSLAGVGSVNVIAGNPNPNVIGTPLPFIETKPEKPLHAILLADLVELTPEQHDEMVRNLCTETRLAGKYIPEVIPESGCEIWEILALAGSTSAAADSTDPLIVDGSLTGAASFVAGKGGAESSAVGGAYTQGGFTITEAGGEFNPIVVALFSNTTALGKVDTEVSSNGGVALSAGGAGSLDVVAYDFGVQTPATGDLIEASIVGDIAFADGFTTKDTSWAKVSVTGETAAFGAFNDIQNNSAVAATAAKGITKGFARSEYCDPLSISLIGAISDVEANGTPNPVEFAVEDETFAMTVSIAVGDGTGLASGSADGVATIGRTENYNWVADGPRVQESQSTTAGAFTSSVEVKDALGISASGAGSEGDVMWDRPPLDRWAESEATMYAYTGGEGAYVKANAGFKNVYTDAFAVDTRAENQNILMSTDAMVTGSGSSSVNVLNSYAQSLANADSWAWAAEDPSVVSIAQADFGVQMLGTNGGSLTAKADLSQIAVDGSAYVRNPAPVDNAWVLMADGGASAILQPKVNTATVNAYNNYEDYDFSLGGGFLLGGFADVNTLSNPNTAYAFRYARAQGQNGDPIEPVPADFIVLWS